MVSTEAFFTQLLAELGVPNETTVVQQLVNQASDEWQLTLGIPKTASVAVKQGGSEQDSRSVSEKFSTSPSRVVIERLRSTNRMVILDDFHHVPTAVRTDLARVFKGLIFQQVPVVVTTAAHNRDILEESEPQLEGRIRHLEVEAWTTEELMVIAQGGFLALDLDDPEEVAARALAEASYGAPILMQQLCLDLAHANGRHETDGSRLGVSWPPPGDSDVSTFMGRVAKSLRPRIFTSLLQGQKSRGTDRVVRYIKDFTTDYYGVALAAIREVDRMATQEARAGFGSVGIDYRSLLSRAKEVDTTEDRNIDSRALRNALENMSSIAEDNRAQGDPALKFDPIRDRLFLDSSFLSFYLRWADWLR